MTGSISKGADSLVKGVNRQIIEINDTGNKYFEKALLFVAAGKSDTAIAELNRQAKEYMLTLSSKTEKAESLRERWQRKNRRKLFIIATAGVILCAAVLLIFKIL